MVIFDRYILCFFIKVLLVCLISITGLYIVIDVFNNLDEFLGYAREKGSLTAVLADYYGARVPWFFDITSSLLTLIAAMFSVTWLQRTREMTALAAAGISKWRIIRPLVGAAIVVSVLAAVNREVVIPSLRHKLTRNAQDWNGDNARRVKPLRDNQNDIVMNGSFTYAKNQRLEKPRFMLGRSMGDLGRHLMAEDAFYQAAPDGRSGWLLVGVQMPENLDDLPSVAIGGREVILSPHDTPWLKPGQCFVVSGVDFQQLAAGGLWRSFASTPQLIAALRNPSLDLGLDTKVTVHSRVVQPLLDLTLFFLGLPLVLARENRNVFLATGLCLLVVLFFFLVVTVCQGLGARGMFFSPALAAWLPLMILAPTATAIAYPILE
ncbi:MAG: LptF/LptG family permease [Pirellulaceae bacterium]